MPSVAATCGSARIVDSNDLPLNVSREILQQSSDVQTIRAASIKRVLGLIEELAEKQADKFATFWKSSAALKEGADDAANRERIARLLRFASTNTDTDEQTVSLADYVGRMKEGQDAIYYITGDSPRRGTARTSRSSGSWVSKCC